jgi:hypothetical protein
MVKEGSSVAGKLLCQINKRVPRADLNDADDGAIVGGRILLA